MAFAALLMAGLDGIQNKIMPPDPIDKDLYDLEAEEKAHVKSTPGSLEDVLDALEADHEFLLKGDVFTKDVVETWVEYKRSKEVDAIRLVHPYNSRCITTFRPVALNSASVAETRVAQDWDDGALRLPAPGRQSAQTRWTSPRRGTKVVRSQSPHCAAAGSDCDLSGKS
jgi:hypothetical protein